MLTFDLIIWDTKSMSGRTNKQTQNQTCDSCIELTASGLYKNGIKSYMFHVWMCEIKAIAGITNIYLSTESEHNIFLQNCILQNENWTDKYKTFMCVRHSIAYIHIYTIKMKYEQHAQNKRRGFAFPQRVRQHAVGTLWQRCGVF